MSTDDFLYDGSGSRVEQKSVVSGTTSDTLYLMGGVEEVTGGVVTKYLGVAGLPTAIRVGTTGALNYLASDGLGSVSEALDGAGNVVATQLYTPYGQTRYSSGAMPTSKGFTGQRADAVSGLDYYGARYYDPVAGQFVSADSVKDGLSPFAYVKGNPETVTDPTGHLVAHGAGSGCGSECVSSYSPSPQQIPWWLDVARKIAISIAAIGGSSAWAKNTAEAAQKYWDTPTVYVSGYTRANGTQVDPYWRRAPGDADRAAEAGDAAEGLRWVGRGLLVVGFLLDAGITGVNYYNNESASDPDRAEKAVIAGVMHATISTAIALIFVAAVTAIPVVGETGVAQIAAGVLGGMVGGAVADAVVTPTTVNAVTNFVNTGLGVADTTASTVGSFFSSF